MTRNTQSNPPQSGQETQTSPLQVSYMGDGRTLLYSHTYAITSSADIRVMVDGVRQEEGYNVLSSDDGSGGAIRFGTPPPDGVAIVIEADRPEEAPDAGCADTQDFSILDSFGTYHRSAARVLDALLASVRKTVSARDIAVAAAASVENPLDKTKNLADVADVDVARANLGIDGISKHIGTGDLADGAARLNLQTHLLPLTNIFFHPTQEYKTSTTINLQDGAAYWFLLVGGGGAGGKGNTPYFHAGGGGGGAGGLSIYAFPIDATRKKAVIEIGTGGATTPAVRGPHSPGGETIVKLVDPVSGRTTEILKAGGGQQGHESLRKSTGNTNAKGGIGGKGYGNIFGIDGERGWDSLLGGPATSSGNPGGKGYFSKWFINTYNRNVVNGVNHHRGFGSGGDGMYSLTLPNNYYDWSPNVQGYHGVVRIWKQK